MRKNSVFFFLSFDSVLNCVCRHLCFHPHLPLAFVANELDSSVTTLLLHGKTKDSTVASARYVTCPLGTTDSLPPEFQRLPPVD